MIKLGHDKEGSIDDHFYISVNTEDIYSDHQGFRAG